MSSRDPLVRHLASQKTLAVASAVRQNFKPYQQVVEAMRVDPGANRKAVADLAKETVVGGPLPELTRAGTDSTVVPGRGSRPMG